MKTIIIEIDEKTGKAMLKNPDNLSLAHLYWYLSRVKLALEMKDIRELIK
ncbi:MAG: hypothetical protein ACTSPB_25970 [Candidatus Thorarchaeota archaeon]